MSPLGRLLKNGRDLVNKRDDSILSAAAFMTLLIGITKILGLLSKSFISYRFGASRELDMFFLAGTLPEFISMILIFGAVNAAFVPVLSKSLAQKGLKEFSKLLSYSLNLSLLLFIFLSLIAAIFARPLLDFTVTVTNPPTTFTALEVSQMANMMRFMFISQIFLGISTIISSALQVHQRFFITQLAPLVYNLGGILGVVILVPLLGGGVWGVVIGLFIGAMMHMAIQIPLFRELGITYVRKIDFKSKELIEMVTLAIPRMVGLFGDQIEIFVSRFIAIGLVQGSMSAYNFAMGIITIPFSMFGHTFSTASFPFLSRDFAKGDMKSFRKTFNRTFQQILFFTLPFVILIVVLRVPYVRIIFGFGKDTTFNWQNTQMTAWVVFFFGIRMALESLEVFVAKTFFSTHNTRTPVITGLVSVVIGMGTALLMSNYFSHFNYFSLRQFIPSQFDISYLLSSAKGIPSVGGIAFGSSVASLLNLSMLLYFLDKKIVPLRNKLFLSPLAKKVLAGIITFVVTYLVYLTWNTIVDTGKTINIIVMTGLNTLLGLSFFLTVETFLKDDEVLVVYKFLTGRFKGSIVKALKKR